MSNHRRSRMWQQFTYACLALLGVYITKSAAFNIQQTSEGGRYRNSDYSVDTSLQIREMLFDMTEFVSSMVDPATNRFYALSRPPTNKLLHRHCPIRDLGAAWDATTLLDFLSRQDESKQLSYHRQRLLEAVHQTLQAYNGLYVAVANDGVALDPDILREPSTVAHSALFLLLVMGASRLDECPDQGMAVPVEALVQGILSRQRLDGALVCQFDTDDDVYTGIEFYPGEAMVGLMEVYSGNLLSHDVSIRQAILPSMERAFQFYSKYYYQGNADTNYNTWQVQAFSRLHDVLPQDRRIAKYVLDMCKDIVTSRSWKELARGPSFYPNLEVVEIACGLDAVAQGIRVASKVDPDCEASLWPHVSNAVRFLKAAQEKVSPGAFGNGGLGYGGIQVLEQRLDVTGHSISALIKVHDLCKES